MKTYPEIQNAFVMKLQVFHPFTLLHLSSIKPMGSYVGGVRSSINPLGRNISGDTYTLTIDVKYYTNRDLLRLILAKELWYLVFRDYLEEDTADDISYAMVWDSVEDGETRRDFVRFWSEAHPGRREIDRNTKLNLKGFVELQRRGKEGSFKSDILRDAVKIKPRMNRVASQSFVYGSVKINLSVLTTSDLKVWEALVNNPQWDRSSALRASGVSEPTFQKAKKKLLYLKLLSSHREFSESRLGMRSVIAVYPTSDLKNQNWPKFPIVPRSYVFANNLRMKYVNFLTPHKMRSIREWSQKLKFNNAIIGVEREDLRYRRMSPSNYDLARQNWTLQRKSLHFGTIGEKIELDFQQRKILIEMFRNDFIKEDIYKKLGSNRNKVFRTISELEKGGALWRQYQMTFLTTMERILVVNEMEADQYIQFLERYAALVPYAWMSFIETPDGKHSYMVGVMGLPPSYSRGMIKDMFTWYEDIWVMNMVSSANIYPNVYLRPRAKDWRMNPLTTDLP